MVSLEEKSLQVFGISEKWGKNAAESAFLAVKGLLGYRGTLASAENSAVA